jgi:hypothetical protein
MVPERLEHLAKKDFVALSFLQNIFSECPGMRFFYPLLLS